MSPSPQPLLAKSPAELTEWVQSQELPPYRAKQIRHWLYQKQARSLLEMSDLPKAWRERRQDYPLGRSSIEQRRIAPDQTRKYLLKLQDGLIIETVGIPSAKRLTVCVSSQVGCAMDCSFCATGKGGFLRNLEAYEIVDQVLTVQE
ncbi:MAG: 23S rRNA (adenine(2503)-C(2))-methyltransferase RlmN, partial [Cyanobacteriota bacterium]